MTDWAIDLETATARALGDERTAHALLMVARGVAAFGLELLRTPEVTPSELRAAHRQFLTAANETLVAARKIELHQGAGR